MGFELGLGFRERGKARLQVALHVFVLLWVLLVSVTSLDPTGRAQSLRSCGMDKEGKFQC